MHDDPRDLQERIYDELRELARKRVGREAPDSSLQATALVHEVWLKLSQSGRDELRDSSHFYATAAQAMRWLCVDRARRRRAAPRDAGSGIDALSDDTSTRADEDLLALDEALDRLAEVHGRPARVLEHRHFAGLSVEATAEALGLSTATVKRDWAFARAWLSRALAERN